MNQRLFNLIREVDTFESSENDLVAKSGIKFCYRESGEYYPEIMKFINFLIELPNKEEIEGKKKEESLG